MTRAQFAIVLAVVAVAGFLGGALSDRITGRPALAQEGAPKAITAEEFRLVDGEGKLRAVLGLREDGMVSLTFNDQSGRKRASVAAGDEGAAFVVGDEEGEKRMAVGYAEGAPVVILADTTGRDRIALTVADDIPGLVLKDEAGTERAGMMFADGVPFVSLFDGEGRTRAVLNLEPDGRPAISLFDVDEQAVWSAP